MAGGSDVEVAVVLHDVVTTRKLVATTELVTERVGQPHAVTLAVPWQPPEQVAYGKDGVRDGFVARAGVWRQKERGKH